MSARARASWRALPLVAIGAVWLAAPFSAANGRGGLETAVADPGAFGNTSQSETAFARVRATGATSARIMLFWSVAAPTRPGNPADPADPVYQWQRFDRQVVNAQANGLAPIVGISEAPPWARDTGSGIPDNYRPNVEQLALFAEAAARRYGGSFQGLPRVRRWQVWNEPNHHLFLNPRGEETRIYARMINSVGDALRRVHSDNLVVAGGLAPFSAPGLDTAPLRFMRGLFCMSRRGKVRRRCARRVPRARFDVWSHHPYTKGGPTHQAADPDEASLGDLPEIRKLLRDATRLKRIKGAKKTPRLWVTEFGWDTNPPDPAGVPLALHARWTAEALHQMWTSGVSLATWWTIRDRVKTFQTGLYFACPTGIVCDTPKPSMEAFRFPFVAYDLRRRVRYWARSPYGIRRRVVVEQKIGGSWRRLLARSTNSHGILSGFLRTRHHGALRARLEATGETSVAFKLRIPPEIPATPFGS